MGFIFNRFLVHFLVGVSFGVLNAVFFRKSKFRFFRFGGEDPVSAGTLGRWLLWYSFFSLPFELTTSALTRDMYLEFGLSFIQAVLLTAGLFIVDRVAMMFEPEERWHPKSSPRVIAVEPSEYKLVKPNDSGDKNQLPAARYELRLTTEALPTELPTERDTIKAHPEEIRVPTPPTDASREAGIPKVPSAEATVAPSGTSWFKKNLDAATERLGEVPKGVFGKLRTAVSESQRRIHEANAARKQDAERRRKDAETERDTLKKRLADEREERLRRLDDITRGH